MVPIFRLNSRIRKDGQGKKGVQGVEGEWIDEAVLKKN